MLHSYLPLLILFRFDWLFLLFRVVFPSGCSPLPSDFSIVPHSSNYPCSNSLPHRFLLSRAPSLSSSHRLSHKEREREGGDLFRWSLCVLLRLTLGLISGAKRGRIPAAPFSWAPAGRRWFQHHGQRPCLLLWKGYRRKIWSSTLRCWHAALQGQRQKGVWRRPGRTELKKCNFSLAKGERIQAEPWPFNILQNHIAQ